MGLSLLKEKYDCKVVKTEKQSNVWSSFMTAKLEKWKSSQIYGEVL